MDEGAGSGSQAGRGGVAGRNGSVGGSGDGGTGGRVRGSGDGGTGGRTGGSGRTGGRAGGSGVGGQGAAPGASGSAGQAGRSGSTTQLCPDKQLTREEWCNDGYAQCDLSRDERLAQACRPGCSSWSCLMVATAANSCGGTSISASYGVDVAYTLHHYDAHGVLIGGLRRRMLDCLLPQGGNQYTFGEQCTVTFSSEQVISCDTDADGGT
ncbi:MAG TPA: hypothetical protein VJV78_29130, partial [Polyangiales bacterium]|nr:hypothetical protein [Polyangiales bacterium]